MDQPLGKIAQVALDTALLHLYTLSPHKLQHFKKLSLFKQLLTTRPADPFDSDVLDAIETVIKYTNNLRPLTSANDIRTISLNGSYPPKIALWKGDITTLYCTAIVNAANSALLGCFKPNHPCIDNAIHAIAGPRLRQKCAEIVNALPDGEEVTGSVKVTPGYLLPARYVLHTVGPIVRGHEPDEEDREELKSCYRSCLAATEELKAGDNGTKTVAFCCISTGMFGYPARLATPVAVATVLEYFTAHPNSTIDRVIFNVFSDADYNLYLEHFQTLSFNPNLTIPSPPKPYCEPVVKALSLLSSADALLIFAGAGLSASCGLDYTSTKLFEERFGQTSLRTGALCLYDIFGMEFPSELDKWGYYFTHLTVVGNWPLHDPPVYDNLKTIASSFNDNWFVRTSNADGLFRRHGFPADRLSTPQGDYTWLQCVANCTPESVFPSQPCLDAAKPYLDLHNQTLSHEDAIPKCPKCTGEMFICVRANDSFNDIRFREGEQHYAQFLEMCKSSGKRLVVLEIGAGWNTPGVLRRISEELVEADAASLVRIGIKGSELVPWGLDGAVGIEGDAKKVVEMLLTGLDNKSVN
ncbi:macro domain-like protein [Gymnopus androsaceus JB14]|uniref:Macro domain-like protein n=1 Tax=Gymnopus androsaceus JB14 TaxID=1447944 RepID=A0A6A4HJT8_9AGAR|nr:macro domain-like protein [Gymnopus androsaceus JB14]